MKPINVGLLGIGTVGGGTFAVLRRNREEIARRAGCTIAMKMVADKDLNRAKSLVGDHALVTADAERAGRRREVVLLVLQVATPGGDERREDGLRAFERDERLSREVDVDPLLVRREVRRDLRLAGDER